MRAMPVSVAMWTRLAAATLAVLLAAGCTGTAGPTPAAAPSTTGAAQPTTSGTAAATGPTPVIIDTDLSTDDTIAIAFLLRDPSVSVQGVTVSGTGLVHCAQGLLVIGALLQALGDAGLPTACGREQPVPGGHEFPAPWRAAADAGYGLAIEPVAVSSSGTTAPQLLASLAKVASRPPMLLSLGPMTNIADAFAADASLPGRLSRIVAMAGAVDVTGNVQAGSSTGPAEWNVYADPIAAAAVLASKVPITLVPLDATNDVPVTDALRTTLAADHVAAPADIAYELLMKGALTTADFLWDPLAAVLAVDDSVATFADMPIAVQTADGADSGRTSRASTGSPIRVATNADRTAFEARLLAGLRRGAARPQPFTPVGTITVGFDGTSCTDTAPATMAAGDWLLTADSSIPGPAFVAVVTFKGGSGWNDLVAYAKTHAETTTEPPSFLDVAFVTPPLSSAPTSSVVRLGAGSHGVVCLAPEGKPMVVLGRGAFTVAP